MARLSPQFLANLGLRLTVYLFMSVLRSRVKGMLTIVVLLTLLTSTHEPPSTGRLSMCERPGCPGSVAESETPGQKQLASRQRPQTLLVFTKIGVPL